MMGVGRKVGDVPIQANYVINNRLQIYALRVCINPNDAFYALRISYTADNAGD